MLSENVHNHELDDPKYDTGQRKSHSLTRVTLAYIGEQAQKCRNTTCDCIMHAISSDQKEPAWNPRSHVPANH